MTEGESIELKEYILAIMARNDRAVDAAFAAQKEAIGAALASANIANEKAETNNDKWRASANEWREAMTDREAKYVSRSEYAAALKSLEEKISAKNIQIFVSLSAGLIAVVIAVYNFASAH